MFLLLAALLTGQSPLASQAPVVVTADQVAKKPKQICQMTEVTGSRFRRRVCHDENGYSDPMLGVSNLDGGKLRETHPSGTSGAPMATIPPN